jgi:hypothetical protein
MSRILKRPMFRKGGEVMEGIMTGIKPRERFSEKGISDSMRDELKNIQRRVNLIDAFSGASASPLGDPLTQFLLQTGQNLISGESAGGTKLQEISGATKEPLNKAIKAQQLRDLSRRKMTASLISKIGTGDARKLYNALKNTINPKTGKLFTYEEVASQKALADLYRKEKTPGEIALEKSKEVEKTLSKYKDYRQNPKYGILEKKSINKAIQELERRPGLAKITSKGQDVFVQGRNYEILEPTEKTKKTGEKIKLKQLKPDKPEKFETNQVYYMIEQNDFFIFDGSNLIQVPPK